MKDQFERNGADPLTTTQTELLKLMKAELAKYSEVIKKGNIKVQ